MFNRSAVDRHWLAIRYVTNKVLKTTFEGEYTAEDVLSLALEVASNRHALWEAGKFPPGRDLEIHLLRAIRKDRYARGWRQEVVDGMRQWVGVTHASELDWTDHDPRLADWKDEPYRRLYGIDDGKTYALMADWPQFTPRQRQDFARFMEARYPEACRAFEDLDREAKPPRVAWARWESGQDLSRARLRVTYARELAEARFAVQYGTRAEAA